MLIRPMLLSLLLLVAFNSTVVAQLNISGNPPLPVAYGGTGAATLTGIVSGNGTGALTATNSPTISGVLTEQDDIRMSNGKAVRSLDSTATLRNMLVMNSDFVTVDGSGIGTVIGPGSGTASSISLTRKVYATALTASSALQSGILCLSSGNEIINDSVACLASSERFKHDIEPLRGLGLSTVLQLQAVQFFYNDEPALRSKSHDMQQVGFIAEQAEKIDPRLVGYDNEGKVRTFRYENYTAILTRAIQELEARIRTLEAK